MFVSVHDLPARARLGWLAPVLVLASGCWARTQPTAPVRPAAASPLSIRLATDAGGAYVFEVANLDPPALARWVGRDADEKKWQSLFRVAVKKMPNAPLAGQYSVGGGVIRFTPRYRILPNLEYHAAVNAAALGGPGPPLAEATLRIPRPPNLPAAAVERVYPTADKLPENLLKIYVHFTAPMHQGRAYEYMQLLGPDGKPVALPFLEIAEELWDPSGKRLTLLLDPGRVKEGLKPREEFGPILTAGRRYTLIIAPQPRGSGGNADDVWSDIYGQPLQKQVRKEFEAGPPEKRPIDPAEWTLTAPAAGSSGPLTVTFPRPLDHALLQRVVRVVGADGRSIEGDIKLGERETSWQFTPRAAWAAGDYVLEAESILEDMAGNRIGRAFEVDETGPQRDAAPQTARRPFTVSARGR
jgi:hypothetical protein